MHIMCVLVRAKLQSIYINQCIKRSSYEFLSAHKSIND